jgi:hypothetical protein
MILGGFGMTVGGAVALALPDDEGWIESPRVRVTSDAVALVGEDIDVELDPEFVGGRTLISWEAIPARLEFDSRNDKEVFVGVARQADVDRYLDGVAIDRVDLFSHHDNHRVVLGATEVVSPIDQDFWVASSTTGMLDWDVADGEWTVAVLNTDGTPGVDVAVTAAAKVPFLRGIGIGLIIFGVVGLALGATLVYFGVRQVPERPAPPAPPLDPPPPVTAS